MKRILFFVLASFAAMSCSESDLSKSEIESIALAQEGYRTAWLQNDSSKVMKTLSKDVILLPPGIGTKKVKGRAGVKKFWFPESDTVYIIKQFEIADDEIFW
jgi:ketosteroid isomerase-like protein